MTQSVEFTHEVEELGLTLTITAEYEPGEAASYGNPDTAHPGSGPELRSATFNAGDGEVDLDALDDVYVSRLDRQLVWIDNIIHTVKHGVPAVFLADVKVPGITIPPRHRLALKPAMCDQFGHEFVRHLVPLSAELQKRIEEKISEADFEHDPAADAADDYVDMVKELTYEG